MPIYNIVIDGKPVEIELKRERDGFLTAKLENRTFEIKLSTSTINPEEQFTIQLDGKTYKVEMSEVAREKPLNVRVEEATFKIQLKAPPRRSMLTVNSSSIRFPRKTVGSKEMSADAVAAPMTGRILSIYIKRGAQVKEGQKLCILEAMKMENEIVAPKKGIVQEICVSEGSPVNEGDDLFIIR